MDLEISRHGCVAGDFFRFVGNMKKIFGLPELIFMDIIEEEAVLSGQWRKQAIF